MFLDYCKDCTPVNTPKPKCAPRKVSKNCKKSQKLQKTPDFKCDGDGGKKSGTFGKYAQYLPEALRKLGPKHLQIAWAYIPSMMIYGAALGLGTIYFSEWKAALQYLPYYNGKYNVAGADSDKK